MRRAGLCLVTAAALALVAPAEAGQVTVGSGASVDLGTGQLGLGCGDLSVAGSLSAGTVGVSAARNVTIDATGVIDADSGTLVGAGDWSNAGTFNRGTSTVSLVDGCGASSVVVDGNTTFTNLEMTTTSGKRYKLANGSTQTVTDSLTIGGEADPNQLVLRSTTLGGTAELDFQGGSQPLNAPHVDVRDNHAIGTEIQLAFLDSEKGSNTPGWLPEPGATLSLASGAVLLALFDRRRHRRR